MQAFKEFARTFAVGARNTRHQLGDSLHIRGVNAVSKGLKVIVKIVFMIFTGALMLILFFPASFPNIYQILGSRLPRRVLRKLGALLLRDPNMWPFLTILVPAAFIHSAAFSLLYNFPDQQLLILTIHALIVGTATSCWFVLEHKAVHKKGIFHSKFLNIIHKWILGPFNGFPVHQFSYHVFNHHIENNSFDDVTCTMTYQRDNLYDFFLFYWRFVGVMTILPIFYYVRKNFRVPLRRALLSIFGTITIFVSIALLLDLPAALILIAVPLLMGCVQQTIATWAEHGLVDPDDAVELSANTTTWLSTDPPITKGVMQYIADENNHLSHHYRPNIFPIPPVDELQYLPKFVFVNMTHDFPIGPRFWQVNMMLRANYEELACYLKQAKDHSSPCSSKETADRIQRCLAPCAPVLTDA